MNKCVISDCSKEGQEITVMFDVGEYNTRLCSIHRTFCLIARPSIRYSMSLLIRNAFERECQTQQIRGYA